MTQFAPVAPPQLLRALREQGEHVVGRYHLLLAHDVAAKPHEYKELLPPNSMVIMDNSIIELGYPVTPQVMGTALSIVPSQVVVLPDVIRKKDETLELSFRGADFFSNLLNFGTQQFMVVPQGNSLEELKECAYEMRYIEGVGCWGVGRFVTEMLGSRAEFVKWLWETRELHLAARKHGPFIHLLGFSENMEDDIACAKLPGVLGIDSAVPVRMGQNRQMISRKQKAHAPRGDWWDTAVPFIHPETVANLSLVRSWIQYG